MEDGVQFDPPAIMANIIMGIQQKLREFRMAQLCHVKCQDNRLFGAVFASSHVSSVGGVTLLDPDLF